LHRQRGNKVTSGDAASIPDWPRIVTECRDERIKEDFPVAFERCWRAFESELGNASASCFADGVVVGRDLGCVELCEGRNI